MLCKKSLRSFLIALAVCNIVFSACFGADMPECKAVLNKFLDESQRCIPKSGTLSVISRFSQNAGATEIIIPLGEYSKELGGAGRFFVRTPQVFQIDSTGKNSESKTSIRSSHVMFNGNAIYNLSRSVSGTAAQSLDNARSTLRINQYDPSNADFPTGAFGISFSAASLLAGGDSEISLFLQQVESFPQTEIEFKKNTESEISISMVGKNEDKNFPSSASLNIVFDSKKPGIIQSVSFKKSINTGSKIFLQSTEIATDESVELPGGFFFPTKGSYKSVSNGTTTVEYNYDASSVNLAKLDFKLPTIDIPADTVVIDKINDLRFLTGPSVSELREDVKEWMKESSSVK